MSLARQKDRRRLNAPVGGERRKPGGSERRHCPACGGRLDQIVRKLPGGTVTAATCSACGWSRSSRQTDADGLTLKMAWPLKLEKHEDGLAAVLPPELTAALRARAGDVWTLAPLTSPVGDLPVKWSLSVKKARP